MQQALVDLLKVQKQDGGFFVTLPDAFKTPKTLNHWCHGAPGAIAPLLASAQLFVKLAESGDEQTLAFARKLHTAAMKSAELTWTQGIVLKGNGLCHGISGNGLLLHSVARWHSALSQDQIAMLGLQKEHVAETVSKFRKRALMFGRALSL